MVNARLSNTVATVFTVAELCERWKRSGDYVRSLIHNRTLRALPVPPGTKRPTYRVLIDSVLQFEVGGLELEKPKQRRRKQQQEREDFVEYF